tara:strand:+ start:295 stop:1044 length:750 start_codon:yes stop_codon:yes gene_type:complete
MKYKKILIYGGTSEISTELIRIYQKSCEKIIIFSRSKDKLLKTLKEKSTIDCSENKIEIFEVDLLDLEINLDIIKNFESDISGIFWVAGFTGNPEIEYSKVKDAEENLMVNLVNPVIILTELSKKIIKNNSSFIAVFCSVAGLRGRKKQLYYSTSKSGLITFMSGLRQKLFNSNITVMTIIPGYMSTRPFREGNWNSPGFLITKPKKVALIIKEAVDKKKEIIYINTVWKFIMKIITSIPEKIYKRLSF